MATTVTASWTMSTDVTADGQDFPVAAIPGTPIYVDFQDGENSGYITIV